MELLKIARVPPILVSPTMTVMESVLLMAKEQVGAVVVADPEKRVLGIFTERDNLLRVSLQQKDLERTTLTEVMTAPVRTANPEMDVKAALALMVRCHFRHPPIVDSSQHALGIVSVRYLLMRLLSEEKANVETLAAYVGAGGPG